MTDTLPAALSAEKLSSAGPAGRVNTYIAGSGPPLLLIHSVNAAASAAEVRPLFEHYRTSRSVFCIDLPGYGFSERSDRDYSPRLMTDAIHQILGVIRERCGPAPIDALALSLSCEFLARAASEAPAFRTLALVSPTGFRGRTPWREPPGTTRGKAWLYRLLRGGGTGRWIFEQLTRPGVIRYFLERTWGSKAIDEPLWRYDILTAKPPGAEHAPLHFLSGNLFSADIHTVYELLAVPVWLSHGVRGDFTDYTNQIIVQDRPNWRFKTFATGALPPFEAPQEFIRAYDEFLRLDPALISSRPVTSQGIPCKSAKPSDP